MTFSEALLAAMEHAEWTPTKVAAACNVSESAVRKWLNGSEPRRPAYEKLRTEVPGFADLLDGKVAA